MLGGLFSGGKDSIFALHLAKSLGYEISCLITIESENPESYMFHTPAIDVTKQAAQCLDIPLITAKTPGKKDDELSDLKDAISKAINDFGITGIITGAITSVYQSSRIQEICFDLGIECFNPLWQIDEVNYMESLINSGFDVMITGVSAFPLDDNWLGRRIDKKVLSELKSLNESHKINVAGEGGEFETLVLDCPLYKKALSITGSQRIFDGDSGRLNISEVKVVEK